MKRTLALVAIFICIAIIGIGSSNRSAEAAFSTAATPPGSALVGTLPAAPLLNSDGTLNLQTGARGAVGLAGWRVSLDPQRGPVFAPDAPTSAAWSALGNGLNNAVLALAVSGSNVYVGGDFTQVCGNATCDSGNLTVNYVAQWNGSTWSALGSGVGGEVYALAVSGSDVYVGGAFTQVCGNATCDSGNLTVNHIAHWNGSAWSALNSGVDNYVHAIAVNGSDVYVGGDFIHVCGYLCLIANTRVNYVAKWDGNAWYALGGGVDGEVDALAVSGSDVYVGGLFTQVCGDYLCSSGNILVNNVAHWDGSTWSALGSGVNYRVVALAVSGSDVYVGGYFTQVCGDSGCNSGNIVVNYVAHWNGSTWSALGNGVNTDVLAFAVSGNDVYAGGHFTDICGTATCNSRNVTVNYVAHWNGSTWSALDNGVDGEVDALGMSGSDVYGGGFIHQVCGNAACNSGNSTVNNVAKYSSPPIFDVFLPLISR